MEVFIPLMWPIVCYLLLTITLLLTLMCFVIYMFTKPYPVVERFSEETYFIDSHLNQNKFPSIHEPCSVYLSVVVPAYNEEERLPPMLDEALAFLEKRLDDNPLFTFEVIIVSDGSKDQTVNITKKYVDKHGCNKVRCLKLIQNRGKGGAVRLGVESSRGATILFADADGASKFEDVTKLEKALADITQCNITNANLVSNKVAIAIGSRAHLEEESLSKRSIFRNILMYGFHFLVWLFTVQGIKDTQCGFKLFTRKAAAVCFESLHVNRWAFDVELLYIAQKLNIPIAEVPVRWTEIEGSKVTPVISWIQMGIDLGLIWLKYRIGAWKIRSKLE